MLESMLKVLKARKLLLFGVVLRFIFNLYIIIKKSEKRI